MQAGPQGNITGVQPSIPPKGRWLAFAAVIIAVVVVVSVVFFVILLASSSALKPTMVFSAVDVGGSWNNQTAAWQATQVSAEHGFEKFKMRLLKDDVYVGTAHVLVPGVPIAFDVEERALIGDADGDGKLSDGDVFLVYRMTGAHAWSFLLLWTDDSLIDTAIWNTEEVHPTIIFSSTIDQSGTSPNITAIIVVAGVGSPISEFNLFKVQMQQDGIPLAPSAPTLSAGTIISFSSSTVKLMVTDLGGEGKLTAGDSFKVYGMSSGHTYRLSLLWGADGSEIQSATWST